MSLTGDVSVVGWDQPTIFGDTTPPSRSWSTLEFGLSSSEPGSSVPQLILVVCLSG